MQLDSLKKSPAEMSDDELRDLIMQIRADRRKPAASAKPKAAAKKKAASASTKKNDPAAMLAAMSPEQLNELIKELKKNG